MSDAQNTIDPKLGEGVKDPNVIGNDSDKKDTNSNQSGSPKETVSKDEFDKLKKELEEKNSKLEENQDFMDRLNPFLTKLEGKQEYLDLAKAIMEDKLSPEMAKAVVEGKVSVKQAENITKAHEELKKELGEKKVEGLSSDQLEKLLESKISSVKSEYDNKIKELNARIEDDKKLQEYKQKVDDFIKSTPDFPKLSEKVNNWLENHPEEDNIEIAYSMVKKTELEAELKKIEETRVNEAKKGVASNAVGGYGRRNTAIKDDKLVDRLFGGAKNPNVF
jgi:hypothetical protein